MPNQSNLNEGKGRTDEKVVLVAQESRVQSDLPPPPPPLDPSFSSFSFSSLPPIFHDPSQVTATSTATSGDPVAAQIAQLFSIVGRLSSENEALKAQVALHSSAFEAQAALNARLSSENEELRKRDEEKEKTMKEMTKAFGSHWVWEAGTGEGKGRWLWSGEKYRRATPKVTESKPPPSLDSLPVELFNSIASLCGRPELLALCQVSFNLLEKVSPLIYYRGFILGSREAASFVSSRISTSLPPDNRISLLLLPSTLALDPSGFDASDLATLGPPLPSPPIPIDRLVIFHPSSSTFIKWSPVLQLLNPSLLQLDGPGAPDPNQLPTTFPVTEEDLFFLRSWTRLLCFLGVGEGSVPVLRDAFALFPSVSSGKGVKILLASHFSDGRPSSGELLDEKNVARSLLRTLPVDGAKRTVYLQARWEEE